MKMIIVSVLAFAIGIAATLAVQNPGRVRKAASLAVEVVETRVSDTRRSQCTQDFLRRTSCFQNPKTTAKECEALIAAECGTPE
jgi:hypothetical protein